MISDAVSVSSSTMLHTAMRNPRYSSPTATMIRSGHGTLEKRPAILPTKTPLFRWTERSGDAACSSATHGFDEAVEQRAHVMRTRARFRVSLEAEGRRVGKFDALVAAIEQRPV